MKSKIVIFILSGIFLGPLSHAAEIRIYPGESTTIKANRETTVFCEGEENAGLPTCSFTKSGSYFAVFVNNTFYFESSDHKEVLDFIERMKDARLCK
ncbi:MAG TPA: hypothetical protein VJL87_01070 [Bdellovibrionota bacterium]|nr:hypothetical protein [Bdellovibrionota bacterium]